MCIYRNNSPLESLLLVIDKIVRDVDVAGALGLLPPQRNESTVDEARAEVPRCGRHGHGLAEIETVGICNSGIVGRIVGNRLMLTAEGQTAEQVGRVVGRADRERRIWRVRGRGVAEQRARMLPRAVRQ